MGNYEVKSGDTLGSIAKAHGMNSQELHNHPENSTFKQKRPDPNKIQVGDQIWVPDAEADETKKNTDTSKMDLKTMGYKAKVPQKIVCS